MPLDLPGVYIARAGPVGVEVLAFAHLARPLRSRLTGAIEDRVLFRVEAAADPHRTAPKLERIGRPGIASGIPRFLRNGIPRPQVLSALGVVGLDESARRVAADDHFAVGDERRLPRQTPRAGDLRFPDGVAGARIDGDERAVGGGDEQLIVENRGAALRGARQWLPLVLPDDVAAARIDGVDAIELRDVHDAVVDNRHRLNRVLARHPVYPLRLQP